MASATSSRRSVWRGIGTSWRGREPTYERQQGGACAVPAMSASLSARRPSVDVLALLPGPLLSRLRVALGPHHTVAAVDSFPAFERMLRRRPINVAVVDPESLGESALPPLISAVARQPSLVLVAYMAVSPRGMKAVVELASRGVRHIVLKDYDDEPEALRTRLESLPADALSAQMLDALAPLLDELPTPIATAIERLFKAPHTVLDVEDLVRAAGLPRRSFDRALERAGFASARQLVRSARVLRAYSYLRNGRHSPEEIAQRLGYASPQQCWRHVKLVTGFGFDAVRQRLEPKAFIEQVTARLRRGDGQGHDDPDPDAVDGVPTRAP